MNNLLKILHFSRYFVVKDFKNRFSGNVLGKIWLIINPILLILMYSFVFSYVLKIKVNINNISLHFIPFLLTGLFPWLAFSESISRNSFVIIEYADIVKKIFFPLESLVIGTVISNLIIHFIAFFMFIIPFNIYEIVAHGKAINLYLALIPFVIFFQSLAAVGIGFIVSSLTTYLRDLIQLVAVLIQTWFYASPIIYPISLVPEEARSLFKLNPFYGFLEMYRSIIFEHTIYLNYSLLWSISFSLIVFILGLTLFKKLKAGFVDVL